MIKAHYSISLLLALLFLIAACDTKQKTKEGNDEINIDGDNDRKRMAEITSAKALGLAYLEENKLEEAAQHFRRIIELSPNDAQGYANLGVVFLRMGKYDEALANLRRAVNLAPNDPDIRLNLAKVYELQNEQEASLAELRKSEEMAPDHVKTLYSIAEKYEGAPDTQSAAQWENYMRKIVETAPRNIVARMYLVEALIRSNKGDEALKNLEEAQQIYPEFPSEAQDYYTQSTEFLQNKKLKEAFTQVLIFHNFLKLSPEYQGGIRELKGGQSAAVGIPVISFTQGSSSGLQEGESILDVMKFTDATSGAGLDFFEMDKLASKNTYLSQVAVADMDNDGDHDLYFSVYDKKNDRSFRYLMKSDFGRYKDITASSGISHSGIDHFSRFVDYDNDGFLDLYISNSVSDILYRNVSEGLFENRTLEAGLNGNGFKSLFVDFDHDGDLDIINGREVNNMVFQNTGDGTFTAMTAETGLSKDKFSTRDFAFGDFDNDGDIDLVVVNKNGPVQVFSNQRQ
jgi:tetratricopeptide (TPR) repeat protein